MTIKPQRMYIEVEDEKKLRYLKRIQEDREARRSLNDFLRHQKEEEDDAAFDEIQRNVNRS
jgi:hypothetical protein